MQHSPLEEASFGMKLNHHELECEGGCLQWHQEWGEDHIESDVLHVAARKRSKDEIEIHTILHDHMPWCDVCEGKGRSRPARSKLLVVQFDCAVAGTLLRLELVCAQEQLVHRSSDRGLRRIHTSQQ